jgi:hypothetical protein
MSGEKAHSVDSRYHPISLSARCMSLQVYENAAYVGETENLTVRYNNGYGRISPRNCFQGGQSANCRVNNLILDAAKNGHRIELWFTKSSDRKTLEERLIARIRPPWNRK